MTHLNSQILEGILNVYKSTGQQYNYIGPSLFFFFIPVYISPQRSRLSHTNSQHVPTLQRLVHSCMFRTEVASCYWSCLNYRNVNLCHYMNQPAEEASTRRH
ncbi:hypothetical protein ILYODFUR_019607 [Ilyodon furcidens]|uniref:Uncharacterized protein n=1 Tax=Ilyodon furcidens TaxID=33524 RepID=A0ABV0VFD8_9TELE